MRLDQFAFRWLLYAPTTYLRGQDVLGRLQQLRSQESINREERAALQAKRLNSLVATARASSPGYRRRLEGLPSEKINLADLRSIEPLTKKELRDDYEQLMHCSPPPFSVRKTTGGSTGEPVTVLKSRHAMAWELAATWRGYGWAGVHVGDRQARFWGVPLTRSGRLRARLIDFICHRRRFSAFDFDSQKFSQFDATLRKWPADYFYGYVSMLVQLAEWYSGSGRQLPRPPRSVITTSEVLTPNDRHEIESAFGSRVFNEYGSGELGTIAHECEMGSLHTSDENMIIEILDGDTPCAAGEKGEIVVTELNNTALPLIRYRTGDFGALSPEPCPCGRTLGVLSTVYGRAYDFIVAPDGRKFHAEFLVYVFEEAQRHASGISQFQVHQLARDHLKILVVPAPGGFAIDKQTQLTNRIRGLLGHEVKIDLERVRSIAREPSGKMRVIVGLPPEKAVSDRAASPSS